MLDPHHIPRDQFVSENPKLALWMVALGVLATLYVDKEIGRLRAERVRRLIETSDAAHGFVTLGALIATGSAKQENK